MFCTLQRKSVRQHSFHIPYEALAGHEVRLAIGGEDVASSPVAGVELFDDLWLQKAFCDAYGQWAPRAVAPKTCHHSDALAPSAEIVRSRDDSFVLHFALHAQVPNLFSAALHHTETQNKPEEGVYM